MIPNHPDLRLAHLSSIDREFAIIDASLKRRAAVRRSLIDDYHRQCDEAHERLREAKAQAFLRGEPDNVPEVHFPRYPAYL